MPTTVELLKASAIAPIQADLEDAVAASASMATTQAGIATTKAAEAANSANAAAASATTALQAQAVQYKGGVAGGSVPATAPLAGDYYKITSAGTSQSKTWVIGDQAIYNGTSGSWTQVTGYFAAADAADIAATAALIEREGLRFDGTAGAVIGNGGIPAVGTGDFTFVFESTPTSPAAAYVLGGASVGAFAVPFNTSGVSFEKDQISQGIATGALTATPHVVAMVRASAVSTIYVDNVVGATGADVLNYTQPSAYLGRRSDGFYFANNLSHALFFNYALTASEIAALQRRGLVTLPHERGGSMVALNTSAFTNINMSSFSGASATGFTSSSTGNLFAQSDPVIASKVGQRFLASFTATITGGVTQIYLAQGSTILNIGNGVNSLVLTATANGSGGVIFNQVSTGTLVVSGFSIIPLGTLFEQDSGQRHAGYMVRDTSGSARHLELPETGVSIIDPSDTGFIEYTRATDGYLIGDRRVIPSTGYLVEIVATGNGTATLGESAGTPANVCASVTLTSTPKILPILVTQTSTGKLYADLGTATTATFKIRHRAV